MASRSARAEAEALAHTLGASIRWSGHDLCIEAPAGHLWAGALVHGVVCSPFREDRGKDAQLWARALDEMRPGLTPCTDPECDVCSD